jgi:hypothetical protein
MTAIGLNYTVDLDVPSEVILGETFGVTAKLRNLIPAHTKYETVKGGVIEVELYVSHRRLPKRPIEIRSVLDRYDYEENDWIIFKQFPVDDIPFDQPPKDKYADSATLSPDVVDDGGGYDVYFNVDTTESRFHQLTRNDWESDSQTNISVHARWYGTTGVYEDPRDSCTLYVEPDETVETESIQLTKERRVEQQVDDVERQARDRLGENLDFSRTSWQQLKPVPRDDLGEGTRAEVYDPLWLLGRQWQVGEFDGEDAGSPVRAELFYETDRLNEYDPEPGNPAVTAREYALEDGPLEAMVEREPVVTDDDGPGLELAAEAGQYFLRVLDEHGYTVPDSDADGGSRPARADDFPDYRLSRPDEPVDAEGRRYTTVVDGRGLDGAAIYEAATTSGTDAPCPTAKNAGSAGKTYRNALKAFTDWFADLYDEPTAATGSPWTPDRMEYQFGVATGDGDARTVFEATDYAGGRLDWYSFGVDRNPDGTLWDGVDGDVTATPDGEMASTLRELQVARNKLRAIGAVTEAGDGPDTDAGSATETDSGGSTTASDRAGESATGDTDAEADGSDSTTGETDAEADGSDSTTGETDASAVESVDAATFDRQVDGKTFFETEPVDAETLSTPASTDDPAITDPAVAESSANVEPSGTAGGGPTLDVEQQRILATETLTKTLSQFDTTPGERGLASVLPDVDTTPTKATYPGMPAPRYWEFEDGSVNLNRMRAGPGELGKTLLLEYATLYGNDWYQFDIDAPLGSLSRVTGLTVTDTFGEVTVVPPTGHVTDEWGMFTFDDLPNHDTPGLFLPPVVNTSEESDAVEEVVFTRDEMANLAFAIETTVEDPIGDALERTEFRLPALELTEVRPDTDPAAEYVEFANPGEDYLDVSEWEVAAEIAVEHSTSGGTTSTTERRTLFSFPAESDADSVSEVRVDPDEHVRIYTADAGDVPDSVEATIRTAGESAPVWNKEDSESVSVTAGGSQVASEDIEDVAISVVVTDGGDNPVLIDPLSSQADRSLPDYRFATDLAEYWLPMKPVIHHGDDSWKPFEPTTDLPNAVEDLWRFDVLDMRFRLAQLVDADLDTLPVPLGEILDVDDGTLSIYDEELTRAGLDVTRTYQHTRWLDGDTHLWSGRTVETGLGELASELEYDVLEDGELPDTPTE